MRSKANLKGHPIHPMLIPFPLAFLVGGFVFDLIGALAGRPALWTTGYYLVIAGILTALLAAVPGFIDYFYSVPPNSSGKRRATRHMIGNLTTVVIFAVAWVMRGGTDLAPGTLTLVLEAVGTALLGVGGWLGGTLVSRNLISVDHRYAEAGQWSEIAVHDGTGSVAVAEANELDVDQMKLIRVGGKRLVLGRTPDGYVAFDDHCTHRGGSLADGVLICGTVQCLWHGSQFDTRTGKVLHGPAGQPIGTYPVELRDGKVHIVLRPRVGKEAVAL